MPLSCEILKHVYIQWWKKAGSVYSFCHQREQEGTPPFFKILGSLKQRILNETPPTRKAVSINALLRSGLLVSREVGLSYGLCGGLGICEIISFMKFNLPAKLYHM